MGRLGVQISKPSKGMCKRILRYMAKKYAISAPMLANQFCMSLGTAHRYLNRLIDEDRIYPRYKSRTTLCIYYSVRSEHGLRKVRGRTATGTEVRT